MDTPLVTAIVDVLVRLALALLLSSYPVKGAASAEDVGAGIVKGYATWYDAPSKQDAAAGPSLRHALGPGWRNTWVRVTRIANGTVRSVTVMLSDFCACRDRHGQPTLIDLDDRAFADLGPLSSGVVAVRVEAIEGVPTKLPATDTAGG